MVVYDFEVGQLDPIYQHSLPQSVVEDASSSKVKFGVFNVHCVGGSKRIAIPSQRRAESVVDFSVPWLSAKRVPPGV